MCFRNVIYYSTQKRLGPGGGVTALRPEGRWFRDGKSAGNVRDFGLSVTEKRTTGLLGCAHEADSGAHSIVGRAARDFYFARRSGALGGVAISLFAGGGRGGSICESGRENLFHYFRVSDYDAVVEGIWEDFDDWVAGILRAAG